MFKRRKFSYQVNADEDIKYQNNPTRFLARKSIVPILSTVVKWEQINVEVNVGGKSKKILDNISGEVNNLEMIAILGPSGAGKSTLLNTIAGRIKNYSGSVNFYSKDKKITFAYVSQTDYLTDYLTVKESLMFASKCKNSPKTNHKDEVDYVLTAFNLCKSKDNYTFRCSGGERKRLSIGLEMISKPNILILDEPTSGLDSTTSYVVIDVLKSINKNSAIITTIHQPNSNLFQLFDKCYVLTGGKCIYNGSTCDIVDHLFDNFNIRCPNFVNPADFILDVANNRTTEKELIVRLSKWETDQNQLTIDNNKLDINGNLIDSECENCKIFIDPISNREIELKKINRSSFKYKNNYLNEYYQNFIKLLLINLRDPKQLIFRLIINFAFPFAIHLTTPKVLNEDGCIFKQLNSTHIFEENTLERYQRQSEGLQSAGITFDNTMFVFFSAYVPAILQLNQYIDVLKKEHLNSYYSITSFYIALMTVDLLLALFFSISNSLSFFYFMGFEWQSNKFLLFWLIIYLSSILGQLSGIFLNIIIKDSLTALVIGCFYNFALHTLSGFIVPIDVLRGYIQGLSYFVFCRHTFEATMRIFYSSEQCRIADHLIFNFDDLTEFIKFYNHNNNNKIEEIEEMSIKIRNVFKEQTWNKTMIFEMINSINDLNENEFNKLNDFWLTKTNYILNSFNCEDNSLLIYNFIIILIIIILFIILCYFMLLIKIRR